MVTSFVGDMEPELQRLLAQNPSAEQCTIVSALSEEVHIEELPNVYAAGCFEVLRERLMAEHPSCRTAVHHVPLMLCPITPTVFVLPASSAFSRFPNAGGVPAGWATIVASAVEREAPPSSSLSVKGPQTAGPYLLARALTQTAAALGHGVECYSSGPFSKLVGRAMGFIPPLLDADGRSLERSAALVLVDRLADLVSPLLHEDILIDRMYTSSQIRDPSLRPAIGSIPMLNTLEKSSSSLVRGSLAHPHDKEAVNQTEFLLARQGKDSKLFIRKWFREVYRKEGLSPSVRLKPGVVTPGEMKALATTLLEKGHGSFFRHMSLLQIAYAAESATSGENELRFSALAAEQKRLLLACAESAQAAAAYLRRDLIPLIADKDTPLYLVDAFLLVLIAFSIRAECTPWFASGIESHTHPFGCGSDDAEFIQLCVGALCSGNKGPAPDDILGTEALWNIHRRCLKAGALHNTDDTNDDDILQEEIKDEAKSLVVDILQRLQQLAMHRETFLSQLKRLTSYSTGDDVPRITPFLQQLTRQIVSGEPVPDLKPASASLSGLLKSGLGRLGLQTVQSIDHDVIIVFVIGGISLNEIHHMKQEASIEGKTVLIGSTHLLPHTTGLPFISR